MKNFISFWTQTITNFWENEHHIRGYQTWPTLLLLQFYNHLAVCDLSALFQFYSSMRQRRSCTHVSHKRHIVCNNDIFVHAACSSSYVTYPFARKSWVESSTLKKSNHKKELSWLQFRVNITSTIVCYLLRRRYEPQNIVRRDHFFWLDFFKLLPPQPTFPRERICTHTC